MNINFKSRIPLTVQQEIIDHLGLRIMKNNDIQREQLQLNVALVEGFYTITNEV